MAAPIQGEARERYTILGAIHRGGMGEILLARVEGAEGFSRKLVLKGLLPSLIDDKISLELFRREAKLMARLEHPNVVRVLDFAYVGERPYLAMEYVRGRNFHQVIQRAMVSGTRLPLRIATHVVAEALRGIHYAHHARDEQGEPLNIIHRDISPGNILLGFFGEVKVTDFGIAKAAGAKNLTGPRSIRGKARYAAPELVRGEAATVQSDVYSAGVVLAEALTGEPLFDGRAVSQTLMQIVTEPRERTMERIFEGIVDEVPGLRTVLKSAVAMRADQRFGSTAQMADALDNVTRLAGGNVTPSELGQFLRELFAGAADMPKEDDSIPADPLPLPAPALGAPPPAEAEATPCQRPSKRPQQQEEIPRPVGAPRRPHWRRERTEDLPIDECDLIDDTIQIRARGASPKPAPILADPPLYARGEDAPEGEPAVYFSELVPPEQTAQEVSGPVGDDAVDRLAELSFALWLRNPWVLVMLGALLGAATAIAGSLLAISGAR